MVDRGVSIVVFLSCLVTFFGFLCYVVLRLVVAHSCASNHALASSVADVVDVAHLAGVAGPAGAGQPCTQNLRKDTQDAKGKKKTRIENKKRREENKHITK